MSEQEELSITLQKFLVNSYAYYKLDESLVSDSEYDAMAKKLLEGWSKFEHKHKYLVDEDDLTSASLFSLHEGKYPSIVISCATMLVVEKRNNGE